MDMAFFRAGQAPMKGVMLNHFPSIRLSEAMDKRDDAGRVYNEDRIIILPVSAWFTDDHRLKGDITMNESPRDNRETNGELDCSVTIYDGSWMTCDMIEEEIEE